MKFIEKFMPALPIIVLIISLVLAVGFVLMGEPYLAGAWITTSVVSGIAIIYIQMWRIAENTARAERLANRHLTNVIARHIEEEGNK